MQLDINSVAVDMVGWVLSAGVGFMIQWVVRLRRDINAAHKKIREIMVRIDRCQTHASE
jgi:hypothetical protein